MEIEISTQDLARISRHCEAHYPDEGCGILIGRALEDRKVVEDVILTDNVHAVGYRARRYTIPPEQLVLGELEAEKRNLQVLGYFHSHPDHPARPSIHDFERAWPDTSYMILAVKNGATKACRSWQLQPDRSGFVEEPVITREGVRGRKHARVRPPFEGDERRPEIATAP